MRLPNASSSSTNRHAAPLTVQNSGTPQREAAASTNVVDSLTPAQREAAAKMAWRRQMEKTLLQIPPPKAQQNELNFVPNPNQPDFLFLVGLDDVVERLLANKEHHLAVKLMRSAGKDETAPGKEVYCT